MSTASVIDTFYVKYCSVLTQYYKINLLIEITFLVKKYNIFLDPFLCYFMLPKTTDNLSVNIDHVYCTVYSVHAIIHIMHLIKQRTSDYRSFNIIFTVDINFPSFMQSKRLYFSTTSKIQYTVYPYILALMIVKNH